MFFSPEPQPIWPLNKPISHSCSNPELQSELGSPPAEDFSTEMGHHLVFQDDDDDQTPHHQSWGFSVSPHSMLRSPPVGLNHGKLPNGSSSETSLQAMFNLQKQDQESINWGRQAHKSQPWQNRGSANGFGRGEKVRTQNHRRPAADSGMRAVFLGGSDSRTGSCGTGVFLPRGTGGNLSDCRNKPRCSTVLIPARVVQALKLHFDQTGSLSQSKLTHNFPLQNQNDVLMVGKNNLYSNQKPQLRPVVPPAAAIDHHHEISLPQEWTY